MVRDAFVAVHVAVTVALGTDAPDGSVTVPVISPVMICADSAPAEKRTTNRSALKIEKRPSLDIMDHPQAVCDIPTLGRDVT